ncbi:MAG: lipopolysaccharide transport system permease protein [Acidobacteriota bacterium]|jgi:lipopolysaccharide transport system permease protein|nr:lipopolysaccharide transport system permease protein [Acidobacteriota bacterium]
MSLKTTETTESNLASSPTISAAEPESAGAATTLAGLPHALAGLPHARILPEDSGVQLNLGDLWAYRELLFFLTWRDIKVRYKQTLMGVAWVVVQPLLTMLIFTLVFNRFAQLDSGPIPYPLFAYSGLLLWTFFSTAISSGTNSLISNTSLVTKVYFPRAFIPAAAAVAGLVDLGVGSVLLVALAVYYRVHVTWGLLLLPVFVMLAAALALGVGMISAALTVKYRDLRHTLPFVLQVWMFASPVIYPVRVVPPRWRWLIAANPMTGILEGFRSSLAGLEFDWALIAVPLVVAPLLLAVAFYVFRRLEDTFADVI